MSEEIGHVYIPAHIMARKDLSLAQKVLFGKIVGLTSEKGYCFASNDWLGKQLDLNVGTVSNAISKMVSLGILVREIERNERKEIIKRKLFSFAKLLDTPIPLENKTNEVDTYPLQNGYPINSAMEGIQEIDPRVESEEKINKQEKSISEQIEDGTWVPVVTHTPQGDYVFRN